MGRAAPAAKQVIGGLHLMLHVGMNVVARHLALFLRGWSGRYAMIRAENDERFVINQLE